jgi:fibronectin-binding autotransporter adhesin
VERLVPKLLGSLTTCIGVVGFCSQSTQATPITWTGATGGQWETGTNWNPNQTPTTSDALTILGPSNATGALSITFGVNNAAGSINFTNTSTTTIQSNSGAGQTLTLQSGGLVVGSGAVAIGTTTSTTRVTVALAASQTWDVGLGGLTTNGLSGNFVVTKTGTGTWTVQNSSSTIGGITLDNGTIQLNSSSNSVNVLGSSTATFTMGTATNPANNVILQSSSSGPNNLATNIVVTAGAGTRTIDYTGNGSILNLAGAVTLNKELIAKSSAGSGGGLQFNGILSGVGGLGLDGNNSSGGVILNNANTYSGDTRLSSGKLTLKNQLAAQNSTINLTGSTAGALVFDSAVTGNAFTVGGLASVASGNGKDIALQNNATTPAAIALSVGNSTTDASYAGVLSGAGSIIKIGSNTQTFTNSNTYTGATTISGGTLSVAVMASGGSASGIGASSNAAANLVINGGTLKYAGGAVSSDRSFTVGDSNATLDGSGTGAMSLTVTSSPSFSTVNAARTLTFTGAYGSGAILGSGTNTNLFSGTLADNGTGALAVIKSGNGNWRLDGVNTYSGGTTLAAGGLHIGNNSALGTGTLTVNGGSLVSRGTSRTLANAVVVGGNFSIGANDLATGVALTFSNSVDLGAATRSVTVTDNVSGTDATFGGTVSHGGLTKAGAGTLVLNGSNTYASGTSVAAGELATGSGGRFGTGDVGVADTAGAVLTLGNESSISDSGVLSFGSTSVINLNFTGTEVMNGIVDTTTSASLFSNGYSVYTAAQLNTYFGGTSFTGTGSIAVPEPGSLAVLALGGLTVLRRRRRHVG